MNGPVLCAHMYTEKENIAEISLESPSTAG